MKRVDLISVFHPDAGEEDQDIYDFSKLALPPACALALLTAHRGVTALYVKASRRQQWVSLRKFSEYLNCCADPWREMRTSEVLVRYKTWLSGTSLNKTTGTHYNNIALHYRWLADNDSSKAIYWRNVQIQRSGLVREVECKRNNSISSKDIEKISGACKARIVKIRERMALGQALLRNNTGGGLSVKERDAIKKIADCLKNGIIGKCNQKVVAGVIGRASYRKLIVYLNLSTEDMMPYLLLILIETLANPDPIFKMSIDSLEDHPLDPRKKRLYWSKPRAAMEQYADVPVHGQFSIPSLFADIRKYTEIMRPSALGKYKESLFLGVRGTQISYPSVQSWHNCLDLFRKEEGLPKFSFVDIRRSGAQAMRANGETVAAVQRKLQHSQERTSRRYLECKEAKGIEQASILSFQGEIVREATRNSGRRPYETLHGLGCTQPLTGLAPGSRKGEPCLEYFRCTQCPNSIVLIDSPKHVARMIVALKSLDKFEEESLVFAQQRSRYLEVFEAGHVILKEMLNKVPKAVMAKAQSMAAVMSPLPLEE